MYAIEMAQGGMIGKAIDVNAHVTAVFMHRLWTVRTTCA